MKKYGLHIAVILLAIAVISLAIGLNSTAIELNKTKAKLTATELAVKMLGEMAKMKEDELNHDLTIVRAECLRLMMEKSQATGRKWVPKWIGKGIVKPIEPKTRLEVLK